MAQKPLFPSAPADYALKLQNADGVAARELAAAPGEGVMIGMIRACSDDVAEVTLQFSRQVNGADHVLGEVQVPAGAGTNGAAPWVDVLASLNRGEALTLAGGSALKVRAKTAVTGGRTVDVTAEGGRF